MLSTCYCGIVAVIRIWCYSTVAVFSSFFCGIILMFFPFYCGIAAVLCIWCFVKVAVFSFCGIVAGCTPYDWRIVTRFSPSFCGIIGLFKSLLLWDSSSVTYCYYGIISSV